MRLFKAQPKDVRPGRCTVTFSVDLTDPSGVAAAELAWMAFDLSGSPAASGTVVLLPDARNTWLASFPVSIPAGGYLEWSVTAADTAGNTATQPSGLRIETKGGACP
jgi:hypothetical protein